MKYYIILPDGSSLFKLPYPLDFCFHCLYFLTDCNENVYQLLALSHFQDSYIKRLSSAAETSQYSAINLRAVQELVRSVSALEVKKQ